jgi:hypothetical protein
VKENVKRTNRRVTIVCTGSGKEPVGTKEILRCLGVKFHHEDGGYVFSGTARLLEGHSTDLRFHSNSYSNLKHNEIFTTT